MKKLSVLRGGARTILGFLLMAVVFFRPALAQDATKSEIQQNKADEQDVRVHTAAVVTQIQSLIDELAANGITGDDLKVLNATKAALTNLSGPEMDQVIASLQKAGEASNSASSQQNAVNAYAGQKGIILQFRQILKDYEQRQVATELPLRFKDLSSRQTETMLTSVSVARATAGKSASELTSMQQTTQQIAQADQEAIGNEVTLAKEQLDKAAQGSTEDDAKALQQAEKDMQSGALQQALSQANEALKAGQLLKAITQQQIARDELRHIAQDLNPPTNAVDALAGTAAALDKLIEEQKSLLDQTNASADVKPPVTGFDTKQAALVDEANSLQKDLQSLSAPASGLVKDSMTPMQASRATLAVPGRMKTAAASEQEVLAKLEDAQKQLQQQVADAQKAAQDVAKDKDPTAKLQDLQKQIQAAQQQQQQMANQTAQTLKTADKSAPPDPTANAQAEQQQSQLQQQTTNLQKTAQPLSLPASQALAKAADKMNQAQQDLTDPSKLADAQAAQKDAQAALAEANQAVNQQIAQTQQQTADPAALAAAANSLQQAQNSVSSAIAAATPQSGSPQAGSPQAGSPQAGSPQAGSPQAGSPQAGSPQAGSPQSGTPPASSPPSMATAAAALAAAAKDAQAAANTPGLSSSAVADVQQAQAAIAKGQQQAAQGNAPGTASSAAAAEQSLAQAQASVALTQAGLAANAPMPGSPGTPGGPPMPGGIPGMNPTPPGPDMASADGAKTIGGGSTDAGKLNDVTGNGKFVTVASRDRAAIDQTQAEKRPQEYAPMIDQYMKNLADQSTSSSP